MNHFKIGFVLLLLSTFAFADSARTLYLETVRSQDDSVAPNPVNITGGNSTGLGVTGAQVNVTPGNANASDPTSFPGDFNLSTQSNGYNSGNIFTTVPAVTSPTGSQGVVVVSALGTASTPSVVEVDTDGLTLTATNNGNGMQFINSNASDLSTIFTYNAPATHVSMLVQGVLMWDGGTPGFAPQVSAGTGATCSSTSGSTDPKGVLTLVTGSVGWSSGSQCVMTFGYAFPAYATCVFTPNNAVAASQASVVQPYFQTTTSGATVFFNVGDLASRTYQWAYNCLGR